MYVPIHKLKHTRLTAGQEDLGVNIDGNVAFSRYHGYVPYL